MAYDGWAGVGGDLTQGDPPLVVKERGSRYKLSTCGGDDAKAVASALHAKAHQRGWCSLRWPPPPAVPVRLEAPNRCRRCKPGGSKGESAHAGDAPRAAAAAVGVAAAPALDHAADAADDGFQS